MYTSDDVFSIIDTLPDDQRWAVVEYTLKTIKAEIVSKPLKPETANTRWFTSAAGGWKDLDVDFSQQLEEETSKIDIDGWDLSL